jgi:hypothetical protein
MLRSRLWNETMLRQIMTPGLEKIHNFTFFNKNQIYIITKMPNQTILTNVQIHAGSLKQ